MCEEALFRELPRNQTVKSTKRKGNKKCIIFIETSLERVRGGKKNKERKKKWGENECMVACGRMGEYVGRLVDDD